MAATRSLVTLLALVLATMAVLAVVSAPPAHADRCEPTELVVRQIPGQGGYEEPIPEEAKPHCVVMDAVVYPSLGCDSTTLMSCLGSLDPMGSNGCPNPDYPCTPQYNPPVFDVLDRYLP